MASYLPQEDRKPSRLGKKRDLADQKDLRSAMNSHHGDRHCFAVGGRGPEMAMGAGPQGGRVDLEMRKEQGCWIAEDEAVNIARFAGAILEDRVVLQELHGVFHNHIGTRVECPMGWPKAASKV